MASTDPKTCDVPEHVYRTIAVAIDPIDADETVTNRTFRMVVEAAHAAGYAEAVAALRDDARYTDWWMSSDAKPDGPVRQHLADYLETVGPDPSTV